METQTETETKMEEETCTNKHVVEFWMPPETGGKKWRLETVNEFTVVWRLWESQQIYLRYDSRYGEFYMTVGDACDFGAEGDSFPVVLKKIGAQLIKSLGPIMGLKNLLKMAKEGKL